LPQLHSFLSFIGQFLRDFLQLCFSAANEVVQIIAARIDIRIVVVIFIGVSFPEIKRRYERKITSIDA
jgi:hypothetical protein